LVGEGEVVMATARCRRCNFPVAWPRICAITYLDNGIRALLEGLRHASDADRIFRQSRVDAAVQFCAKVFGREYAALLGKAADVAVTGDSKAARA
jgi:hypothetical protein